MTAPDRICAPTSEPFSTTTTERSGVELLEPDRRGEAGRAGADDRRRRIPSPRAAGSSSSPAISPVFPSRRASGPRRPDTRTLLAHIARQLTIHASSTATGMLEGPRISRAPRMLAHGLLPDRSNAEPDRRPPPRELLRWWIEAGVDLALDESPHDRFAESAGAGPAPRAGGRRRRRAPRRTISRRSRAPAPPRPAAPP